MATEPLHLRTYAILAYTCGLESNDDILYFTKRVWKERKYVLRNNVMHDIKDWDRCGYQVISLLNEDIFGAKSTDMTLVYLFND